MNMANLIGSNCSIRLARDADVPALPAVEHAAVQLFIGYAPESVQEDATDECTFFHAVRKRLLWVALSGSTPVGFAHVEMLAADLPHLEELDVHPSHGRRGLGTALVQTVCAWATGAGYSALTLTTFRAVPWNFPFYARLGFEEIPREDLRPELAAVVAKEAARGLLPDTRAVMAYRCRFRRP
jgi:predicted N-acetyltransferase YhbS